MIPLQLNPFVSNASGSPWKTGDPDVPAINDQAFEIIARALDQMRLGGPGTSIVVTGEPGSGKTHLLGRARRALEQYEAQGGGETIYIYVRCNASASTLWRHVRSGIAADLLTPAENGPSRLHRLLQANPERLDLVASSNLRRVLRALRDDRHVWAATAWLKGESLSDSDSAALEIGVERDDEDRNRELEAREIVSALLAFLAPTPTVICFDQVEALATYKGDEAGFHTMAQLVSQLADAYHHLLLISCIVSAFEDMFDRLPNGADRDRWLKEKATLRPIEKKQAFALVGARLDAAQALAAERRNHPGDLLWPFKEHDFDALFEATGVALPRTVLQHSKKLFDGLMHPVGETAPAKPRPQFLREQYEQSLAKARRTLVAQGSDKTLTECLPWLLQTSGLHNLGLGEQAASYPKLAFRKGERVVHVVPLYASGNGLTSQLKKIESRWEPKSAQLMMLRDAAIKPGAKGAQLLQKLRDRGAREINPTAEALAALRAIQDLITSARSGDLAQDGQTIPESEVTTWVLENLNPLVGELRDDLAGPPRLADLTLPKLAALLKERKMMDAGAAARELAIPVEEIKACANRHPLRFGVLSGPPVVVYQAVETSAPPIHD